MTETTQSTNRYALKEWAVVVRALSEGRQTLLLRKGGIVEEKGEFKPSHSEFFLYPTFFHEQMDRIKSDPGVGFESIFRSKPDGDQLDLSLYAVVTDSINLKDPVRLSALGANHILSEEEVERRFNYRDQPGLHLLILRVYQLPKAIQLLVTSDYAGCKSWVDLGIELSTAGVQPVLSDAAFCKARDQIQSILS